jgi:hypothetical protein
MDVVISQTSTAGSKAVEVLLFQEELPFHSYIQDVSLILICAKLIPIKPPILPN